MNSVEAHERAAGRDDPVRCCVLTISDTRRGDDDRSGPIVADLLRAGGCEIVERAIVPDEPDAIGARLDVWIADPNVEAVLTTGGTGLARRDRTIDVVRARLDVELDGFGELFRLVSFREIGAAAMLSRAVGGLVERDAGDTFLFALPGSPDAVTTALRELIVPQLKHLVWLRR